MLADPDAGVVGVRSVPYGVEGEGSRGATEGPDTDVLSLFVIAFGPVGAFNGESLVDWRLGNMIRCGGSSIRLAKGLADGG